MKDTIVSFLRFVAMAYVAVAYNAIVCLSTLRHIKLRRHCSGRLVPEETRLLHYFHTQEMLETGKIF